VPGSCIIKIDRRWLPEESVEEVYEELKKIIEELNNKDPEFIGIVRDVFAEEDILIHKPFYTDSSNNLVFAIQSAMDKINADGKNYIKEPIAFPAWTDAGYLSNYTNTSCVIIGPGDLALAHSDSDSVNEVDLYEAALLYGKIALEFCN
jgi:acetylornithine deacetylase/succinyl-diaminopimelate desuccinylase